MSNVIITITVLAQVHESLWECETNFTVHIKSNIIESHHYIFYITKSVGIRYTYIICLY